MVDMILPDSNQQGKSKKKKISIVIAVVVVVVIAIVGGILMFQQSKKTDQKEVTVVDKKELSPTEKPEIDKKSVKIQVLNGTGTPGQANITVEALKKAGYNPDNIKTANAQEFDNTVTTITARADFEEVASEISDALKATFDEVNIESSQLDENSEFDIVIVTGGKIFEEKKDITPTTKPTESDASHTPSPTTPTTTLTPSPTPTPIP